MDDNADRHYEYISEFGMRVDDPCQAIDNDVESNKTSIVRPGRTTVKDLKYYQGTDSTFWLPRC